MRVALGLCAAAACAAGRRPAPMVVAAGGDLLLGAGATAGQLAAAAELLGPADLRFANLESPLTAGGAASGLDAGGRPEGGPIRLRAPIEQAAWLRGRVEVVSLANNHALDQGAAGRDETARALGAQAVLSAWAGRDAVWRGGGRTVVLVARERRLGPDEAADAEIVQAVRRARASGTVLVSLHWGLEGALLPGAAARRLAARLVDAGAAAVLGHGPHAPQGLERRGRALIAYSLGNLALGCRCSEITDATVLRFRLGADGGVDEISALPIRAGIGGAPPGAALDPGLGELLVTLSRDLGTDAWLEGGRVRLR